jgi:hypothetical protein
MLHLSLFAAICELVVLLFCPSAHALPGGIASGSCNSCHIGGAEAEFSVDFDPPVVQPGDLVTVTIHVKYGGMKSAGFFIQNLDFPYFSDISGQPTHSTSDGVTHSSPIRASGDEATVKVAWTAPETPDGGVFNIAVIAANGDNSSRGDASTWGSVGLVWGCDGIMLYWDGDNDGYGSEDLGTSPGCAARDHWAPEKGDCDGGDPAVNPGATEICNEDDDDCDGEVDEGTNPRTFYPDTDGDGFGTPGVDSMIYCGSLEGYADNSDDCDDDNALIRPGATETCNKLDDNCDGRADEAACSTPTAPDTTPTTSTAPTATAPATVPSDVPSDTGAPSDTSAPSVPAVEPPSVTGASSDAPASGASATSTAPAGTGTSTVAPADGAQGTPNAPMSDALAASEQPSCNLNQTRSAPDAWEWLLCALSATTAFRARRRPSRSPTL